MRSFKAIDKWATRESKRMRKDRLGAAADERVFVVKPTGRPAAQSPAILKRTCKGELFNQSVLS